MNRPAFEYYLREMLLPCLRPGQVLVLDNLSVHHGPTVEAMVREAGLELLYLPAHSPDLNPIEPMFAKVKALLKKAPALTLSALSHALREAFDAVTYRDIQGFFTLLGFSRQRL